MWIVAVKERILRILRLQFMILEKLSIKVNPKKYIDPHGKGKKTRLPDKIWSMCVGGVGRAEGKRRRGMEKQREEEN